MSGMTKTQFSNSSLEVSAPLIISVVVSEPVPRY